MTEASNDLLARVEGYLVQTERHIAEAKARISRQEAVVTEQAHMGHDTTQASRLLRNIRDTLTLMHDALALMHQYRDSLRERKQINQALYVPPRKPFERCPP